MSRRWYLGGLALLVAVLLVIRLSLPPLGVPGPFFGRLDAIAFGMGLAIVGLTLLALFRILDAGMNVLWAVAVLLWTAGCEPALRALLGGAVDWAGYPGPAWNWFEIPVLLVLLLGFLGVVDRVRGGRIEVAAGAVALAATLMRPALIVGGLDRQPVVSQFMQLDGELLTGLLRSELWFNGLKGGLVLPAAIGNGLVVAAFALALLPLAGRSRNGRAG